MITLTPDQAQTIIDAHEINLDSEDKETELLWENNPELADAYSVLLAIAKEDPSLAFQSQKGVQYPY